MLRFLLILLLLYLVWKVVQIFIRRARQDGNPKKIRKPFDHIEDADFEDVSDKPDGQ